MYNMMDVDNPIIAATYCCLLVLIGGFFLLNLVLAVVLESFTQIQADELEELRDKITKNEKELEAL